MNVWTLHLIWLLALAAPDFDTSQWTTVKETLGLDFPNVRSRQDVISNVLLWEEEGTVC